MAVSINTQVAGGNALSTSTVNGAQVILGPTGTQYGLTLPCTIGTLPAPASYIGPVFVQDLAGGTMLYSNGSRYRPLNNIATLGTLDAAASSTASADTVLVVFPIPAVVKNGDSLRLWLTQSKTGTSETVTWSFRYGATGTTSDTVLLSSANMVTAANISGGTILEYRRETATSVQKMGNTTAANGYGGVSSAATLAPVALGTSLENAGFLSISVSKSAAVETATLLGARLEWITSANG